MNLFCRRLLTALVMAAPVFCAAGDSRSKISGTTTYVITNDDAGVYSYASFYVATDSQQGPTLSLQQSVDVGGRGIGGGFFGTSRIAMLPDASAQCVYVSDALTGDIAEIDLQTQELVGNVSGYRGDKGNTNGIGLAVNSNYVYAAYTASNTIGTFAVQPGCQLVFVDDVPVAGLNGGWIGGMAIHGNMMVVAYGDGSIQSFNIANGLPVSNNDEQNSAGFARAYFPESVDITQDGHFAIFGDSAVQTTYVGHDCWGIVHVEDLRGLTVDGDEILGWPVATDRLLREIQTSVRRRLQSGQPGQKNFTTCISMC